MKRGSLIFVIISLLLFTIAPLTGQSSESVNLQTYTVDSFDNAEEMDWVYKAKGSKFVVEGFPKLKYFKTIPRPLKAMHEDVENAKVLGLEVQFNRKGDNWIDIFPSKDGKAYELPFKGIVHRLEMWVWGSGYYYDLEILVRDCEGRAHTLPLGLVNFKGWEIMSVTVPTYIRQHSRYLGNNRSMTFIGFRIRTRPSERVDEFKIYFDAFKALTNTYLDAFDGYELADFEFEDKEESEEKEAKSEEEE